MAMNRPSPAWIVGVYVTALVIVFVGERVLVVTPPARAAATIFGLLLLLGTLVFRWRRVVVSAGNARQVERSFAILSTLGAVAIGIYFASQQLDSLKPELRTRVEAGSRNLWLALVLFSILPQIFGQLALEPMRLAERVEWRRVRGAIASGIVVVMAVISAILLTYTAGELGLRADFSYSRTSRPSDSTVKSVQAMTQPLKVITFFPPASEVRGEVNGYLRDLARRSKTVEIDEEDRLASPKLARDLGVTADGTIVLERGTEHQTLTLPLEMKDARPKLRALDGDFQKALLKVLKNRRHVYLTVGHGELNDTKVNETSPGRSANGLRELLERFNYGSRDLGVTTRDVPDDATVVAILGPTEPFSEQELGMLGRFAERGGHLLLALDPEGKANSDRLASLFGLSFNQETLCDDHTFAARRFNDSDHAIILSNRFSSHASVATLSRLGSRAVFFLGAGSLDKHPGTTADFIVKSLPSTFMDKNGNFKFDEGEERKSYNLAAAVWRPIPGHDEMRAVVVADADAVSDAALMNQSGANGNPQFLADVLKWLGGEESSIGSIADTGEDVRIEHTKQKDTLLFYATIFGAPAVVLALGLLYTRRVRRRMTRRAA